MPRRRAALLNRRCGGGRGQPTSTGGTWPGEHQGRLTDTIAGGVDVLFSLSILVVRLDLWEMPANRGGVVSRWDAIDGSVG